MGFGNSEKVRFCSIKEGRIQTKTDAGPEMFDLVEGGLEDVSLVFRDFGHETVEMLRICLRDEEGLIQLGTSAHGSIGRSLVLSLASEPVRGTVRIRPYKNKAGFNAVAVSMNGNPLRWAEPLAELEDHGDGPDDSARREQVRRLVEKIRDLLHHPPVTGGPLTVDVRAVRERAIEAPGQTTDDDVPF